MNEIFGWKVEAFHYYCSGMNLKYETQGFKSHPHSLQLATVQLQLNSLVLDERIVSRFNTPYIRIDKNFSTFHIILVRLGNMYIPKFLWINELLALFVIVGRTIKKGLPQTSFKLVFQLPRTEAHTYLKIFRSLEDSFEYLRFYKPERKIFSIVSI